MVICMSAFQNVTATTTKAYLPSFVEARTIDSQLQNRCSIFPITKSLVPARNIRASTPVTMSTSPAGSSSSEPVGLIANLLDTAVQETYTLASRSYPMMVIEHESEFGYFHDSAIGSVDALASLLSSMYSEQQLVAFQRASEALVSFNVVFKRLESVSGLDTTICLIDGYLQGGPTEQLVRKLREAVSARDGYREDAEEVVTTIAAKAEQLKTALVLDSDAERAEIHAEAEKLKHFQPKSLEQIADTLSISSGRRDKKAVAFVALALAGWEPDLEGWEKDIARLIRGERSLRGEYPVPMTLERKTNNDILVGISLRRRDTYMTLDGTTLLRVETLHVGQTSECRFVRASEDPEEDKAAMLWGPFERTPEVDWETIKEFAAQSGPVRYEWTSIVKKIKDTGESCAQMHGLQTARAYIDMTRSIKENSPNLYKIWRRSMCEYGLTGLACTAKTAVATRAAVMERMALTTVNDSSCYHIASHPIHLCVERGIARLFDGEGKRVYVDEYIANLPEREAAEVGVKFFGLLARAVECGAMEGEFYQDKVNHLSVLRARGPREGFDRKDEMEDRATRTWERLCSSHKLEHDDRDKGCEKGG